MEKTGPNHNITSNNSKASKFPDSPVHSLRRASSNDAGEFRLARVAPPLWPGIRRLGCGQLGEVTQIQLGGRGQGDEAIDVEVLV